MTETHVCDVCPERDCEHCFFDAVEEAEDEEEQE